MVDAAPFRALRYAPSVAGSPLSTSAPATDDIDRFDYARHRTASPYTVLELVAPRSADDGYAAAAAALARWRRTGVVALDPRPAFYVYEQGVPADATGPAHVQRGVLAAVAVETGAPEQILPHEDTDPLRVAGRLARLLAVPVDIAPVHTIAGELGAEAAALFGAVLARPPLVTLVDEGGARHTVGATQGRAEAAAVRALLADQRVLLADGHHRYAAAAALRRRRPDDPEAARTLMLVADGRHDGPRVLAMHRLLARLPSDWPAVLAPRFDVVPAVADPARLLTALGGEPPGSVALRVAGHGLLLRPRDDAALRAGLEHGSALWRALDTVLVDHVLLPLLGVRPPAVSARADADLAAAEVDTGRAAALVLVRPTGLETIRTLARTGERMPAKSTSFRPKPRTGLILRSRADTAASAQHAGGVGRAESP